MCIYIYIYREREREIDRYIGCHPTILHVYMYTCMYVCMYGWMDVIYIYIHTSIIRI